LRRGEIERAKRSFREALEIFTSANDLSGITLLVGDFAAVNYEEGNREAAAKLAGAVDALTESSGTELASFVLQDPVWIGAIFQLKRDESLQDAYQAGRALSTEQAIAYALGQGDA
jgi:hypothetical protein